jgi:trehalose 6-phosphate synthase
MTIYPENDCDDLQTAYLGDRSLIIVSNRGPVSFQEDQDGKLEIQRSGAGGLVTALLGLARQVDLTWVAAASTPGDREWPQGPVHLEEDGCDIGIRFVSPTDEAYDGYYSVISNPLLWFLQHSMWDLARSPNLTSATWKAWDEGYVKVNQLFADAVIDQIRSNPKHSLVMLQDYHLYLVPQMIRRKLRSRKKYTLTHFVHIPWPGPEDWGVLPKVMREAILDGMCAADLVGFQTHQDALNFLRTVETLLPAAFVNYRAGRVWIHNHATHVRDFPISIDPENLRQQADTDEVVQYRLQLAGLVEDRSLIVRIDRTEPSKNIVRGFQAYAEMLELHPEHIGKVEFLAVLVPSRLEVEEYQTYMDELMAMAGRVNARFGTSDWEPVRVLVGESYPRAIAAMQLYDVLLVNPVADGMNLVAKEGPIVNQREGVLVLSERAGVHQQLGEEALVISPCDVYATGQALHQALSMPAEERRRRAKNMVQLIEKDDISAWMCLQLKTLNHLGI